MVSADPHRLAWVLRELLDNAITFSPPDQTARLRVVATDAVLEVTEPRAQLAEEETDKVSLPFSGRVRRGQRPEGHGLGLSIAGSTLREHDGELGLICEDGTTRVRVRLLLLGSGDETEGGGDMGDSIS